MAIQSESERWHKAKYIELPVPAIQKCRKQESTDQDTGARPFQTRNLQIEQILVDRVGPDRTKACNFEYCLEHSGDCRNREEIQCTNPSKQERNFRPL